MKLPLSRVLRKRIHIETALLQDELMEIVLSIADKPVLHGGTAIWRCYGGNRFSEDLDFTFIVTEGFREKFYEAVASRGLEIKKYKQTKNTIFSKVTNGSVEVRVEVGLRKAKDWTIAQYLRADGSSIDIYTLSPDILIIEKISAYRNRRLIRDIYDIYHLRNMIEDEKPVSGKIVDFLKDVPDPADEKNLRTIVYAGAIPTFQQIIETLRKRFR